MKPLIKIVLMMMAVFSFIFLTLKVAGLLPAADIRLWLENVSNLPRLYMAAIIIGLLMLDLFVSVPTLALIIMSGYFLGPVQGFLICLCGLTIAGGIGYILGTSFGSLLLAKALKTDDERLEMQKTFKQNSFMMIVLARALPMLPEVTALLSGITRLSPTTFLMAWLAGNIPYVLIASYLGSISSLENPAPAIWGAFGLAATLWLGWMTLLKRSRD